MGIKGLSDRRRLPRIGKIHLGVKAQSSKGTEYPKAVDYFVVRPDDNTPEDAVAAFRAVYGEEPRELDIRFPTDDPADWADPWYRAYSRSYGLVCKGDGEVARAKWDAAATGLRPDGTALKGGWATSSTKTWTWQEIPCAGADCPMQKTTPARCKMVMNLQFLLWRVRGIGAWQIDTGSWNSIRNLQDGIELIKAATGGRVRGLPLKLRLSPNEVTPPEGDVKTKTVWVLDISLRDLTLAELLAEATKLGPGLLPPPVDDEKPPEDLFPEAVDEETGEVVPVEPVLPAAPPVTVTVTKQEPMPNSLALHMRSAPVGHDSAACTVCAYHKEKAAQKGKRLEGME